MLLRRIAWHEISQRESDPASSWLLGCQAAADDIVRFVTSLHKQDLLAFWLPYNAHHFTSAVTLLLRCALQTSYSNVRAQCMTSARTLVDRLRTFHEQEKWDLAETALSQSEMVLKRIEDSLPQTPLSRTPNMPPAALRHDHMGTPVYLNDGMMGDQISEEDFLTHHGQSSIEELFPEIFADFTDTALFTGSLQPDIGV